MILPFSITQTLKIRITQSDCPVQTVPCSDLSQERTVLSLWAMVMTVQLENWLCMRLLIFWSVTTSMAEVASSNINSLEFLQILISVIYFSYHLKQAAGADKEKYIDFGQKLPPFVTSVGERLRSEVQTSVVRIKEILRVRE